VATRYSWQRLKGIADMRFVIATLLATANFLSPMSSFAESADVEATIKKVDTTNLVLTLDDGKTYQAPEEFDFEGLKAGVKVVIFYTEVDGKRVINDLDIVK
jgi:Cu/Ag efflux protein CusF